MTLLKHKRNENGLTQVQMATILDVSKRTYQRIENKERNPSYEVILKLQLYFNESITNLLAIHQ